jgi:hypothetical protein
VEGPEQGILQLSALPSFPLWDGMGAAGRDHPIWILCQGQAFSKSKSESSKGRGGQRLGRRREAWSRGREGKGKKMSLLVEANLC